MRVSAKLSDEVGAVATPLCRCNILRRLICPSTGPCSTSLAQPFDGAAIGPVWAHEACEGFVACTNWRSTRSAGRSAAASGCVVVHPSPHDADQTQVAH